MVRLLRHWHGFPRAVWMPVFRVGRVSTEDTDTSFRTVSFPIIQNCKELQKDR